MSPLRVLLVTLAFVLPLVAGGHVTAQATVGNSSEVTLHGNDNAVAICQFGILINSAVILAVEDGLGLVSSASSSRSTPVLGTPAGEGPSGVHAAQAECSTTMRNVNITVRGAPPGIEDHVKRGGVVLGAPVFNVSGGGGIFAGNHASLDAVGEGNSVAVCQFLILVNTVIVGGGALGLESGTASVVQAPAPSEDGQSTAHCKTILENVKIHVSSA